MVGLDDVFQQMPLSVTALPPSLVTFPPLNALDEVMLVAAVVADNTGSPFAALPIIFVHAEPLKTCNSPDVPQLLHQMISPAGVGTGIFTLWAAVILGGKKPLEVLVTSNAAAMEGLVVPIPTWAKNISGLRSINPDNRSFMIL
jgi:hypothetical protein